MATVVLSAYAKAFPGMTNRQRASVYKETDLLAPVATQIHVAPHPIRIWTFPGLPRDNYKFTLDEIDGGGAVIQNLADFDVVPGQIDGFLIRGDEQIKVGTTTGFDVGLNTVTFDGTGGKPDYRGWQITPSELTGRGILVRGLDYSWDSVAGIFTLLQVGDILALDTNYNIHFDPIANPVDSAPIVTDFSTRIITGYDDIEVADFGNAVLLETEATYAELQLPDIATVPQGRILRVEMRPGIGTDIQCAKFLPFGADTIVFLRGNLYICNNESFSIYKFQREVGVYEWRVINCDGNFKNVGQNVSEDAIQSGVFCKQRMDGTIADKFQYSRVYNEVVLTLPGTQVCNYDDWATGNNKYLYSLANSADLGNADKFHFPDRRGIFERNNNAGKAGDYGVDTVGPHDHAVAPPASNNQNGSGKTTTGNTPLGGDGPIAPYNTAINNLAGTETLPKHYLINKYTLV